MVETQRELLPAYAIRGEVSLPLQRSRTHLSRRHGVHADSPGRPARSVLPDRASSTVRPLSALPRHVHREAGKLARAGWEEGANRGRECQPCAGRPCTEALGDAVRPAHQSPLTEGRGARREPLAARRRRSGATLDLFWVCSRRRREHCSCRSARPSAAARSLYSAPTATSPAFTRTPNVGVRSRLGTCSAPCVIARHFSLDGQERRSLATAWLVYARDTESMQLLEARKRISEAVDPLTAKLPKPPRSGVRAADFYGTGAPSPAPAMQHGERGVREPRWLSGATLLLLFFWVGLLSPPARADVAPSLRCRAGTVLMRTDSKICPTERGRPVAAVERACCQGRNGKIRCMHYPQCPPRSPS